MNAEILTWDEFLNQAKQGDKVLIQGALMTFIREVSSDEDCRLIEVKYKKMEMETNVFRSYLTARVIADG
jgi:preprotein translocase subunit YajC